MGIACGDYNSDGTLDLYVTHYYRETDTLWKNVEQKWFTDVTRIAGLGLATTNQLSWGTNFIDANNDGELDLFVTSGHINDDPKSTVPYAMSPQFFLNLGERAKNNRFREISTEAGEYFKGEYVGRSSAVGDFDNDGRSDLVVGVQHQPPAILRNNSETENHAIGLKLIGRLGNRSAIGTRMTLKRSGQPDRVRERIGGGSYLAQDAPEIVIGLGMDRRPGKIEVRWPGGVLEVYDELATGHYHLVVEGQGAVSSVPFQSN